MKVPQSRVWMPLPLEVVIDADDSVTDEELWREWACVRDSVSYKKQAGQITVHEVRAVAGGARSDKLPEVDERAKSFSDALETLRTDVRGLLRVLLSGSSTQAITMATMTFAVKHRYLCDNDNS